MRAFFKTALFLYLLSTLPFIGQFHLATLVTLFVVFIVSIFYEIRGLSLSQPLRGLSLVLYLIFLYLSLGSLWGLEAGVSLLSFLALLKSFELKNKRDLFVYTLIIELSLIGHLLSVDDLYMVIVVLLIGLNLFWLLYQFHHFNHAHKVVYSKDIARYRKKVFSQVLMWSIPLTAILFFVFPRIPLGNLFTNTLQKKNNLTGFTQQVRPGEISEVIQSKVTYFRAEFKNPRPSSSDLYWRGMVLAKTDGFNWDRIHLAPHALPAQAEGIKPLYNYEVEYDFFSNGPLFLLDRPLSYDVKSRSHTLANGGETYYTVVYHNQKIRYKASAISRNSKANQAIVAQSLSPQELKIYLDLSRVSMGERFDQWLGQRRDEIKVPKDFLNLMRAHFAQEKFRYSLSPGRMDVTNPLDDFFFNKKVGLCEHYASITAYGLRRLGFPSRIVVGFQGGQYNPYGEYFSIQGKNAHSWVEFWDAQRGWQRVDPTAWILPDRIRLGADIYFLGADRLESLNLENELSLKRGGLFQDALFMADMIYYKLNREFLNFDFEKQKELFKFLKLSGKSKYLKLLGFTFSLIIVIFLLLIIFIYRQRQAKLGALEKSLSLIDRALKRKGMEVASWWGPERWQSEITQHFPALKDEVRVFYHMWLRLSYQAPLEDGEQRDALRQIYQQAKRIKQHIQQI